MARDPLSVAPVVLQPSQMGDVINRGIEQQLSLDQLRRQDDAKKVQLLQKMQDVQAFGWEQDQADIDRNVALHQENVAKIMFESDGIPSPDQLRAIKRSEGTIEAMAKKSLADKENYDEMSKFVRTHHKDLDFEGAQKGLEEYYAKTPLAKRGVYDITPHIRKEKFFITKLRKELNIGKHTDKDGDGKYRTIQERFNVPEYEDNIKGLVATDHRWAQVYQEHIDAGLVDSLESFATREAEIKVSEQNVIDEHTKLKQTGTTPAQLRENVTFADGSMASTAIVYKGAVPVTDIPVNAIMEGRGLAEITDLGLIDKKDQLVGFDPKMRGIKDGIDMIEGTISLTVTPRKISVDEFKELPEEQQTLWEYSEGSMQERGGIRKINRTIYIPYAAIKDRIEENLKKAPDGTSISEESFDNQVSSWRNK